MEAVLTLHPNKGDGREQQFSVSSEEVSYKGKMLTALYRQALQQQVKNTLCKEYYFPSNKICSRLSINKTRLLETICDRLNICSGLSLARVN